MLFLIIIYHAGSYIAGVGQELHPLSKCLADCCCHAYIETIQDS